jgi:hypothetical protein
MDQHPTEHPALHDLVAAVDSSLGQLESCMALDRPDIVRPILLRRRRAQVMLRNLLCEPPRSGLRTTVGHAAAIQPRGTLFSLWRAERNLIEHYDRALHDCPEHTATRGLLAAQRAEAEQAFLTISAAIQARGPLTRAAPLSTAV